MSFHTTCVFHRPRTPPVVRCRDVALFVRQLANLNVIEERFFEESHVAFGAGIDQDDQPDRFHVPVTPDGAIAEMHEIDWSWRSTAKSLAELASALESAPQEPIYRAWFSLGTLGEVTRNHLLRLPGPENSQHFAPDSLSLKFGKIEVLDRELDVPIHCGWIGLMVSGPGYPYPWTRHDVLARLESDPHLMQMAELCRRTWPVSPEDADPGVVAMRIQCADYWLYDDLKKPWDWYWGVNGI
jgi:hypothetical protein